MNAWKKLGIKKLAEIFSSLVGGEHGAWSCHSSDKSVFQMNPFSNKCLLASTAVVFFLQLLAVYNPWLQKKLKLKVKGISHDLQIFRQTGG